jgi:hypothetical protein
MKWLKRFDKLWDSDGQCLQTVGSTQKHVSKETRFRPWRKSAGDKRPSERGPYRPYHAKGLNQETSLEAVMYPQESPMADQFRLLFAEKLSD